jgi:hypothetical protein
MPSQAVGGLDIALLAGDDVEFGVRQVAGPFVHAVLRVALTPYSYPLLNFALLRQPTGVGRISRPVLVTT